MSDHEEGNLWPTFALRAWLAALLAQTRRTGERLEKQIGLYERMIARLREKIERSHKVVRSLEEALGSVDNVLRRVRDSEILEEHQRAGEAERESGPEGKKPTEQTHGRPGSRGAGKP
jgi:hypothetical protein